MTLKKYFLVIPLCFVFLFSESGQLNVGFDIDDTVLFSRDVFLNIPNDKREPIDYGWVNTQDDGLSIYIDPTVKLVNYFISNGHNVFFITARSDIIAALKAGVHPVRIVRHDSSISQYGPNYFGNTLSGRTKNTPYSREDLNIFYSGSVGMFGESIYPIIWEGPK